MDELNGCEPMEIKVPSPFTFTIGDTKSMTPYKSGGIVTQVFFARLWHHQIAAFCFLLAFRTNRLTSHLLHFCRSKCQRRWSSDHWPNAWWIWVSQSSLTSPSSIAPVNFTLGSKPCTSSRRNREDCPSLSARKTLMHFSPHVNQYLLRSKKVSLPF